MTDIFIAYSHEDLGFKNELKKFLRPMLRDERISVWDDFDIEAGQDWDAKIKERLYGADIILLLVSSDSLASDYFYGKEVKVSLERHAKGEAVVVPIILRHCDWENTPLGGLEALPEKGRPVVEWPTRDQAWQDAVSRLRRVIENIEKQRKTANEHGEALRAFKAAVEAADHLFSNQRWQEARAAYSHALAAHLPGFLPDRSQVTQKIADCDQNLRAEADLARQAAEAEKRRQREEARMAKQTDDGSVRRLIFMAIGGVALLIIIWLASRPASPESSTEKQPNTTETPEQLEDAAYQKALTANTIPALEDYLTQHKAGKNAAAARQKLQDLQDRFNKKLQSARSFEAAEEWESARQRYREALQIDPDDKETLQKLENIKRK